MVAVSDILANYQHGIEDITLTTGDDSMFGVRVNGELVFSKHELGRLAEDGEVLGIFRNIVGPDVLVFGK